VRGREEVFIKKLNSCQSTQEFQLKLESLSRTQRACIAGNPNPKEIWQEVPLRLPYLKTEKEQHHGTEGQRNHAISQRKDAR
jgi:hypothetical protein